MCLWFQLSAVKHIPNNKLFNCVNNWIIIIINCSKEIILQRLGCSNSNTFQCRYGEWDCDKLIFTLLAKIYNGSRPNMDISLMHLYAGRIFSIVWWSKCRAIQYPILNQVHGCSPQDVWHITIVSYFRFYQCQLTIWIWLKLHTLSWYMAKQKYANIFHFPYLIMYNIILDQP